MELHMEKLDGISTLEKENKKAEGLLAKDISPALEKLRALDIDALLQKIKGAFSGLGLDEQELENFGNILQDTRENGAMYGRHFGAAYGGLVCICGSINCSSCYGPLIANSGLCRNA